MSSRRIVVAVVGLGLFVLLDLALFGFLIFRSLSQRELDRIVLETREEARQVANQIAADAERLGRDLPLAVATNREIRGYIDSNLVKREVVRMVRVLDADGIVVFQQMDRESYGDDGEITSFESGDLPIDDGLGGLAGELGDGDLLTADAPRLRTEVFEEEVPYETVRVPIGDMGTVLIGLRREEIEQRLGLLRQDLVTQASSIVVVTAVVFAGAALLLWVLFRRSRRLEERARESERMAYVGTLASGLAHEIRSPLNSLNLNMQMLEEDLGSASADQSLLSITRSEITRLEHLVSDFLRYAKPRDADLERVAVAELLQHAASTLAVRAQAEGVELLSFDTTQGAEVMVDREQIQQMLLNLVDNAVQAYPEPDDRPVGEAVRVELLAERRGDDVALGVRDHGRGMTDAELQQATEVFYSQRRGGTGLGLAIVERIVRSHQGRLFIDSSPESGTTVWAVLRAA